MSPKSGELGLGPGLVVAAPDGLHVQRPVADAAHHHPVEVGALAEAVGRAIEDPGRRADLSQPANALLHALQGVHPPHAAALDQLALDLMQLHEQPPEVTRGCRPPRGARIELFRERPQRGLHTPTRGLQLVQARRLALFAA